MKKATFFLVMCLVVFVAWYSRKPESVERRSTVDSDSAPSATASAPSEQRSRHLQTLQELSKVLVYSRNAEPPIASDAPLQESAQLDNDTSIDTVPEDELMPDDYSLEELQLMEWRNTWSDEDLDDNWTRQMREEVDEKTVALLHGEVDVRHLSCRETVCRMYLQFSSKTDADAFTSAEHHPDMQYEYQLLNPHDEAEGSIYNYELLVHRERPADLEPRPRPRTKGPEAVVGGNLGTIS